MSVIKLVRFKYSVDLGNSVMLLRLLVMLLIRDGQLLNLENDAKLPARAAWLTQGDIWWRQDLFFDEMVKDGSERRQYHQFGVTCAQ